MQAAEYVCPSLIPFYSDQGREDNPSLLCALWDEVAPRANALSLFNLCIVFALCIRRKYVEKNHPSPVRTCKFHKIVDGVHCSLFYCLSRSHLSIHTQIHTSIFGGCHARHSVHEDVCGVQCLAQGYCDMWPGVDGDQTCKLMIEGLHQSSHRKKKKNCAQTRDIISVRYVCETTTPLCSRNKEITRSKS